MARNALAIALAASLGLAACVSDEPEPSPPNPTASVAPGPDCAPDLPPRTSPVDVPAAVLHVAGDDLPPVLGDIRFDGSEGEARSSPRIAIHLERFTVLQTSGNRQASIRMTDEVGIASWEVWAVSDAGFRRGDLETDRATWSAGDDPVDLVCIALSEGDWLIAAELVFADGQGEGTYYWRLNVRDVPQA